MYCIFGGSGRKASLLAKQEIKNVEPKHNKTTTKKTFIPRCKEILITNYFPNTKTIAERVRQATAFIPFPVNASLNSYVLQYSAELNGIVLKLKYQEPSQKLVV